MLDVSPISHAFARTGEIGCDDSTGVLTAADDRFFPGVQLLSASLGTGVRLGIIDLGLSPDQRRWCRNQSGRTILRTVSRVPDDVPGWQMWNKPFYLADSPFQRTLWIDADCVVVGDLKPLFGELHRGPVTVQHWDDPYPQPNSETLYRLFPVATRLRPGRALNAGVVGLNLVRDARLLHAWCWLTAIAVENPAIRSLISWYDEGTLHWALQAVQEVDRILPQMGWNRYVRTQAAADPVASILSRNRLPDDVIWHFSGSPKPW